MAEKQSRTTAKRLFTRAKNVLLHVIAIKADKVIVTSRFEELKGLRQLKHEDYVSSLQIDENEAALKAEKE